MPVDPGTAAIISATIGAAGGAVSGIGAGKRQKREHKHRMELADYAFNKNLEQWKRENAYNSPAAQMERLRQAGINPHLAYGNGSIANESGSMAPYQAPQIDYNAPTPLEAAGQGLAGSAQEGIMAYTRLRSDLRQERTTEMKISLDEQKLEIERLELELKRDYINPLVRLQIAEQEAQLTQRFDEYERVDGRDSVYQTQRKINQRIKQQESDLKDMDYKIRQKIADQKDLLNEYNDFINELTVRKGDDPRETPAMRRLFTAIDQIEDVELQRFLNILVSVGGTILGK